VILEAVAEDGHRQLPQHELRIQPQHLIAIAPQILVAARISAAPLRMIPAVHLHDELLPRSEKVRDERPNRHLPTKLHPAEAPPGQRAPKRRLRRREMMPHEVGVACNGGGRRWSNETTTHGTSRRPGDAAGRRAPKAQLP
jgi:hypothetical protein